MNKPLFAAAILFLTGSLLGCSPKEAVEVAGSSTVLPVVSRAAEQFTLDHPDVPVIVNAGGSGVGINQVGEGKIDVGMASRDLTDAERRRYPGERRVHPGLQDRDPHSEAGEHVRDAAAHPGPIEC